MFRDRGRGCAARAGTTCRDRKSGRDCYSTVREATCARGELPASFLHKLVSHSMGAADCSMAAPGPMLPLCQDLTSLDYHHNIHQLSSTQPPHPHPCFLPSLPLPIPYPQSDPSSWILSEWHPLNLPNYLSSGRAAVALSRQHILLTGQSWGTKGTSNGLPDCSPRRPHSLWHYQPFTVKFKTLAHSKIIERILKNMCCVLRRTVCQKMYITRNITR